MASLTLSGCDRDRPIGPKGDPLGNTTEGHWRLTSLYKKADQVNVTEADSLAFLKMSVYTKFDSAYMTNNPHYIFAFSSPNFTDTTIIDAIPWSYSTNPEKTREVQYYRISKTKGFQIRFYFIENKPLSYQMDLSNIMESGEYREDLDTVRYVYTPTEKF